MTVSAGTEEKPATSCFRRMITVSGNKPALVSVTGIPKVPAHRVVNRNGLLSGKHHFGGENMKKLLEKEGVKVKNDTVVDFEKKFWDPASVLF